VNIKVKHIGAIVVLGIAAAVLLRVQWRVNTSEILIQIPADYRGTFKIQLRKGAQAPQIVGTQARIDVSSDGVATVDAADLFFNWYTQEFRRGQTPLTLEVDVFDLPTATTAYGPDAWFFVGTPTEFQEIISGHPVPEWESRRGLPPR